METDSRSELDQLFNLLSPRTALEQVLPAFTAPDWQQLERSAAQQGLTLVLYQRLSGVPELVPADVWERLREAYLQATARNMVMLHHAQSILGALRARGLDVIVLKGLFLAEAVYHAPGLRTFDDLDLLCRRAELPAALTVMQGLGYTLSTWYDPADPNRDLKHLPPLLKPDAPIVELHWTILEEEEPFTIDVDGLWERRVPARVAGVDVYGLCAEDLVLHLALHTTYQHQLRGGLRGLFDIAAVLRRNAGQFDWQHLVTTAQQWGAQRVAWLTFQLLHRVTGVAVPAYVLDQLLPDAPGEDIVADALGQLARPQSALPAVTPDLAALGEAQGFFSKLALVLRRVFIPRRVMAREYNVDPRSLRLYFYYPVRLARLLREYRASAAGLLRGEGAALAAARRESARGDLREWLGGK